MVLDYRDDWATYRSTYEMMGRASAVVGAALERGLVRAAHAITTATDAFRERLLARLSVPRCGARARHPERLRSGRLSAAATELPAPPTDRFVVTYAGTLFKLTSPQGLLGALRRLHREEPELARLLEVRFIGRIVDTEAAHFEGGEALGVVQRGYLDKDEVVRELAASHMVLCLLDDVPGAEQIYPAKIFELMYLRRPCLTLAPPGALADLCRRHRLGTVIAPRDEEAIAAHLAAALRRFRAGEPAAGGRPGGHRALPPAGPGRTVCGRVRAGRARGDRGLKLAPVWARAGRASLGREGETLSVAGSIPVPGHASHGGARRRAGPRASAPLRADVAGT